MMGYVLLTSMGFMKSSFGVKLRRTRPCRKSFWAKTSNSRGAGFTKRKRRNWRNSKSRITGDFISSLRDVE